MTDAFEITTDPARVDRDVVFRYLSGHSTWARGISRAVVERSLDHSLCFSGYVGSTQVAFARVISDYATFANLVDVFVLPDRRGQGYSKRMMEAVLAHPQLQGLRRFTLATWDAHSLYARYGFTSPSRPESLMERYFPDIYANAATP
ncbi:GNAT family N-acetyltransferase [Tahibacter amnicola]|uniref:GNAT family N-acetyltransferase n=1 Tax=Tahibacter amnicola TaxID=2976241 RepID=A0ABY6BGN7_9GAMM|nr:GNAT family N-acetyltransferase [Tahibacter amnicola]UXI68761.1 GNAT family N-acetyltransferase [Tahibacter amnicola]